VGAVRDLAGVSFLAKPYQAGALHGAVARALGGHSEDPERVRLRQAS
jgi:hypothetical protein